MTSRHDQDRDVRANLSGGKGKYDNDLCVESPEIETNYNKESVLIVFLFRISKNKDKMTNRIFVLVKIKIK